MRNFLFIIILIICNLAYADKLVGTVTKVIDGDTYIVNYEGKSIKVRQAAIDAPEKSQYFGKESTEFNKKLLLNKKVIVEYKSQDLYGRILGRTTVLTDNKYIDVEYTILYYGYAWHYYKYDNTEILKNAELDAKKNKRGIWNTPNPTPPWTYRKNNK